MNKKQLIICCIIVSILLISIPLIILLCDKNDRPQTSEVSSLFKPQSSVSESVYEPIVSSQETVSEDINETEIPSKSQITSSQIPTVSSSVINNSSDRITMGDDKIKAVWISTAANLDFPSKPGLSAERLRAETDTLLNTVCDIGFNTVFLQVVPSGDAIYKSSVLPSSYFITGKQGAAFSEDFDLLKYFIEKAHQKGIEVHAWINPYRICTNTAVAKYTDYAESSIAAKHPEYLLEYKVNGVGQVILDPAIPEVQKHIVSYICELADNYNIDGVNFDDYFYPYSEVDDSESYAKYGNGLSKGDFRRSNTDKLIYAVSDALRQRNVDFGVCPFGIWNNKSEQVPTGSDTNGFTSYEGLYADARKWVLEGKLDYVCPQIYWSFNSKASRFDTLCDWWADLCEKADVMLLIGHSAYKVGDSASILIDSDWKNADALKKQVEYCLKKEKYAGSVFFRYANIKDNKKGISSVLKDLF